VPRIPSGLWALLMSSTLIVASAGASAGAAGAQPVPKAGISISPATPASEKLTVLFEAEALNFPAGAAITYHWDFGDGSSTSVQGTASVQHTYPQAGTFPVSLNERVGSQVANATALVKPLVCPTGTGQCSSSLTPPGPVLNLMASGPSSTTATLNLLADPWKFSHCTTTLIPAAGLTDHGFKGPLTLTVEYVTAHPAAIGTTCFSSTKLFENTANVMVHSGALPMCQAVGQVAPCVESISLSGSDVTKVLSVPPGDPKVGAGP
jgi:PKD repeat protein